MLHAWETCIMMQIHNAGNKPHLDHCHCRAGDGVKFSLFADGAVSNSLNPRWQPACLRRPASTCRHHTGRCMAPQLAPTSSLRSQLKNSRPSGARFTTAVVAMKCCSLGYRRYFATRVRAIPLSRDAIWFAV